MLAWFAGQSEMLSDIRRDAACVHMVSGERTTYIGSMSQRSRPGTRASWACRTYASDSTCRMLCTRAFKAGLHQARSMATESRGMLVAFVVLAGDTLDMRSAEEYIVRQTRPCGNTSLATRGG